MSQLTTKQLFFTDNGFAKSIGWNKGDRVARFAMIIDHGKIVYAEKEPGGDVSVRLRFRPQVGFRGLIHSTRC